jgi:hypothetical protein
MSHEAPTQQASQQQGQIPHQAGPADHREAKAQAKAARAYAKATRPWFKKKRFMIPALAVLLIAAMSAISGGGGDDTDTTTTSVTDTAAGGQDDNGASEEQPAAEEKLPGLGDKVRDGKFLFTVTKVQSGVRQIGGDTFGVKAQGQFVLVHMSVKNIGDEAQTLLGDNQKLFIGGKEYSADTEAGIYLDESKSFIEEINPGNKLKGVVVFDVPKSAKQFDKIEVHDSMFSGGADIELSNA